MNEALWALFLTSSTDWTFPDSSYCWGIYCVSDVSFFLSFSCHWHPQSTSLSSHTFVFQYPLNPAKEKNPDTQLAHAHKRSTFLLFAFTVQLYLQHIYERNTVNHGHTALISPALRTRGYIFCLSVCALQFTQSCNLQQWYLYDMKADSPEYVMGRGVI